MISWIFRALQQMHKGNDWDQAAGDVFGEIAEWLENHSL